MPSYEPVGPYLSMKEGGRARSIKHLKTREDIELFVKKHKEEGIPYRILGAGTNTLFADGNYDITLGLIELKGIKFQDNLLILGAGENWDNAVLQSVERGLHGIEALSAIPGTAGAGPIQNIGAYGSEIKDTLECVLAFDTDKEVWKKLSNADCEFSYRDSFFKRNPHKYIIGEVALRLEKVEKVPIPEYRDVEAFFSTHKVEPSLGNIRQAISDIRAIKLPDPEKIPNCGSFFKNPVVEDGLAEFILKSYPAMPTFKTDEGTKLAAGWLIQEAGLKGRSFGKVSVYERNALVLVNHGGTTSEILEAAEKIILTVQAKFNITLEREPNLLP